MKSTIVSVGTELLMGQVVNSNVVYLSQEMNKLGIDVMHHHTVGDNSKRLKELMGLVYEDCDLVILTGGLGPTQDDLTKEVVTEYFGDELILSDSVLKDLQEYFAVTGRNFTENNRKQCYVPSTAVIFDNKKGTAPGFAIEKDGKTAICLPGPPVEMTNMYQRNVKPYLEAKSSEVLRFRDIRCYGIGESSLETKLLGLINGQTNPTFATFAMEDECMLRITAKAESAEKAEAMIDEHMPKVREAVGKYIYSENGEPLPTVVGRLLIENNISISCAESCTGGMFASTLIDVPGISAVFDRGLVTYSERAKMDELGVNPKTLEEFGAVSTQTAKEMAEGLQKKSSSQMCVSVTGVAGPDGGSEEKPVGLAYIGLVFEGKTKVIENRARNLGRKHNRHSAMMAMLGLVYREAKAYAEK